jgi:general secretion pathway protein K
MIARERTGGPPTRDERGFALVAVLLVLALLGILGAEFAYSMRIEASAARAWRDNMGAAHLAEAGVEQALREIAGDIAFATIVADGFVTFFTRDRLPVARLPRTRARLGFGEFSYTITDEQARININTSVSTPDRLDKLLQCLGVDKITRDPIVDAIVDWVDANEDHRANGAESEDYYLKLPTPYRARNAPLESVSELLQIKGITQALYEGVGTKPGLVDVVTVRGPGQVNVNTAGPVVFCAMGVSDAEIAEITQGRREAPYTTVPGRLAGRGFVATTQTFRIDAEGLVDGKPRAKVTTIVQKRNAIDNPFVFQEWSGVR